MYLFGKKFHTQGTSSKNITEARREKKRSKFAHKFDLKLKKDYVHGRNWDVYQINKLTLQKAQVKLPGQMVDQRGNYPVENTSKWG